MSTKSLSKSEIEVIAGFLKFPYTKLNTTIIQVDKLNKSYEFLKQNLQSLNNELNNLLKGKYGNYIEKYTYFVDSKFSPIKFSANVFAPVGKTHKETSYTFMLSYFLNLDEFKDYLFKALLFLINEKNMKSHFSYDKYILDNVVAEEYNEGYGRIDVVCKCKNTKELIIEAKINASERLNQTDDYFECKKDTAFAFVFLSIDGKEADNMNFTNLSWFDLSAAFYAGYNSYKLKKYNINQWDKVDFGSLEDSINGIYLQMWLSNILTHLYKIEDIDKIEKNEYSMFSLISKFINEYEKVMEALNG